MSEDNFYHLLKHTNVEDVLPKNQQLVTIDSSAPLPTAFRILSRNNIYSAPVYNPQTKEYSGFLDMLDIVSLIVHIIDKQEAEQKNSEKRKSKYENVFKYLQQVEEFDAQHADRVVDFSKRNPMCPLQKGKSLLDALQLFSVTGANRIPIVERHNHIMAVLTLSTVITWLTNHLSQLGPMKSRTVREMTTGLKDVVTVQKDCPAIEAFRLMSRHRVNSVAVVDPEGKMFANLSSKDIKLLDEQVLFRLLNATAFEFVVEIHKTILKTVAPVMYCTLDSTFEDVVRKINATKVHRLYIADENKRPIGVLSLGDIADFIILNKDQEEGERTMKG